MVTPRLKFLAQQGKCFYETDPMGWTRDHFYPKSKYRSLSGTTENVVLSCKPCNSKKASRRPTEKEVKKHFKFIKLLAKV